MKKALWKKGFYQLVCLLLVLSMVFGYLSDTGFSVEGAGRKQDNTSALQYAVFTGAETGSLWFNARQTQIAGSVRSNSGITQAGERLVIQDKALTAGEWKDRGALAKQAVGGQAAEGHFTEVGELQEHMNTILMPQLFEDMLQTAETEAERTEKSIHLDQETILLEKSQISTEDIALYARTEQDKGDAAYYDGYIETQGALLADGNIHIYAKTLNAHSGTIIASREGDIIIHAENLNFNGILYAPNGKILIHSKSASVTGRIYGNSFESQGELLVVQPGEQDLDLIDAKLQMDIYTAQFTYDEKTQSYQYAGKIPALKGTAFSKQGISQITYSIDNRLGHFEESIEGQENWRFENPPLAKGINGIQITVTDYAGERICKTVTLDYQFEGGKLQKYYTEWDVKTTGTEAYDLVVRGDTDITSATTYTGQKILYTGDLHIFDEVRIQKDAVVVVQGDLILEAGALYAESNARICVEGKVRIQKETREKGYEATTADVCLGDTATFVAVGDFYTQTQSKLPTLSENAVLELHGDFISLGSDTYFKAADNSRLLFAGAKEQSISVAAGETDNVILGAIQVENAKNRICLASKVNGIRLLHNTTIKGETVALYHFDSNGYHTVIEGNYAAGGTLQDSYYVTGDLFVEEDTILHSNAWMAVAGDVHRQQYQGNGSYTASDKVFRVTDNAKLVVKGNYITENILDFRDYASTALDRNAVLELHGDFIATGEKSSFKTGDDSKIIFAGESAQSIDIQSKTRSNIAVGTVLNYNRNNEIELESPVYGLKLTANTTIRGAEVYLPDLNTNGYQLTIEGNYASGGTLNGIIRVKGDLYPKADTIFTEYAYIEVTGDVRNQTRKEDGTFTATETMFRLTENARLVAKQDFYTENNRQEEPFLSQNAILEIHENFWHKGQSYFTTAENARILFSGKRDQHVSFDSANADASLGRFTVTNTAGKFYFDTPVYGAKLLADTTLYAGASLENLETNGYKLTVQGALLLSGRNELDGKYHIQGDLIVQSGSTAVTKNTRLEIDGNLRIEKKVTDHSGGVSFETTTARFYATDESETIVKGNLYVRTQSSMTGLFAGAVLRLYGDLYQLGEDNYFFGAINSSQIIFDGTQDQTVRFEADSEHATLGNIAQARLDYEINIESDLYGIVAFSNLKIRNVNNGHIRSIQTAGHTVEMRNDLQTDHLHLNEGALKCDGNLVVSESINIKNGSLWVLGDLRISPNANLEMKHSYDKILVNGSFINSSAADTHIYKGILEVHGDFIHNTSKDFNSYSGSYIRFNGPGSQRMVNHSIWASIHFYNLEVNKELSHYPIAKGEYTNLSSTSDPEWARTENKILTEHFGKGGVYAPTGNYSQTYVDLAVPTILGAIQIGRTYNSLSEKQDSIVGRRFTFSHDIRLMLEDAEELADRKLYVHFPDGRENLFSPKLVNLNVNYVGENTRNTLVWSGVHFILTTPEQTKYGFDQNGYLQYIEDKQGNRLLFILGDDRTVEQIRDSIGTLVQIHYNNAGQISSVENSKTSEAVHYYYEDDLLIRVEDATGRNTRYIYDSENRVSEVIAQDGTVVTQIGYVSSGNYKGKVEWITDVTGNSRAYFYDDLMHSTQITDSEGRMERQWYDAHYNVVMVENDLGMTFTTRYHFIDGYNKYGEVAAQQDANNNTTFYERDEKGNITKITYPDGATEEFLYDAWNNVITSQDKGGAKTFYVYDAEGRNLLKIIRPVDGKTEYSSQVSQNLFTITEYTYYQPGEQAHVIKGLVKTETPSFGDSQNYIAYTYNHRGLVTAKTLYKDGVPYRTSYAYNSKDLLVREEGPEGVVTEITYGRDSQIIRKKVVSAEGVEMVERTVYDLMGRAIQKIDPNSYLEVYDDLAADSYNDPGAGVRYTYNAAGQVVTETKADGYETAYEYDVYGNLVKEIYPNKCYIVHTYDAMNRKLDSLFYEETTIWPNTIESFNYKQVGACEEVEILVDDESFWAFKRYDWAGRLVQAVDRKGNTTEMVYDLAGNLIREIDVFHQTTLYEYDAWGNLISVLAPFEGNANSWERYYYDKYGNLTEKSVCTSTVGSDHLETIRTAYTYDKWGNLLMQAEYEDGRADPSRYEQFYYDYKGQLLRHYKGLTKPLTIHGLDQVTSNGDSEYTVLKYQYNSLGQVTKTLDALNREETFQYDKLGNILSATDKNGTETIYRYNRLNQLVGQRTSKPGSETITRIYTYDEMGYVSSAEENEKRETYTYDGRGRVLKEVKENNINEYMYIGSGERLWAGYIWIDGRMYRETMPQYEWRGKVDSIAVFELVRAFYTYDEACRITNIRYYGGEQEATTYNAAGLVSSVVNTNHLGELASSYSYTYTVDGRQRSKTDLNGTTQYLYDGLNRLSQVWNPDGSIETYCFDDNGNRTEKLVETPEGTFRTTYRYDANDQLLQMTEPDGTVTAYTYDANGNLLRKVRGNQTVTQDFDLRNRLVRYADKDTVAEYCYDVNDLRISKTVNGVTTLHIWEAGKIQMDITNGEAVDYVHGNKPIQTMGVFCLYDGHGNVTGLTSRWDGGLVNSYEYDAYGIEKDANPEDSNPFRYCGEYTDLETGYVYLKARYYDPSLGRFISMDSYKDGSNWYNYCGGDPVNYIDPSGHFIISMAVGIGIAALVGATFAGLSIYEGFLFQEYTGRSTLGIIAGGLATGAATGISTFFFLQTATAFLVNYVNYSAMAAGLAPVVTCAGGAGAAAGASAMAGLALYGQSGSLALPASAGQLMLPAGSMPFPLLGSSSNTYVNTNSIHFMQSSIKNQTGEYTVLGNAEAISNGSLKVTDLPKIKVWKDSNGKMWTLDHRRLATFKLAGVETIPFQMATPTEIANQMWKMTTKTAGKTIRLKLGNGESIII